MFQAGYDDTACCQNFGWSPQAEGDNDMDLHFTESWDLMNYRGLINYSNSNNPANYTEPRLERKGWTGRILWRKFMRAEEGRRGVPQDNWGVSKRTTSQDGESLGKGSLMSPCSCRNSGADFGGATRAYVVREVWWETESGDGSRHLPLKENFQTGGQLNSWDSRVRRGDSRTEYQCKDHPHDANGLREHTDCLRHLGIAPPKKSICSNDGTQKPVSWAVLPTP